MNNNMYAMVLFLLVITTTSSVLCCSNNEGEVFTVVEIKTLYMQPGMVQNPVQLGRFSLKDGKEMTLSRPVNGVDRSCVHLDQPCGIMDWCCEGLTCDGIVFGKCRLSPGCLPKPSVCDLVSPPCCYPNHCDAVVDGNCVE